MIEVTDSKCKVKFRLNKDYKSRLVEARRLR